MGQTVNQDVGKGKDKKIHCVYLKAKNNNNK